MATLQTNSTPYAEWVQPSCEAEAYNTGDVVSFNGDLYESTIDGNTGNPKENPRGWIVVI